MMSFDYEELRSENRRRYGTDIRRVGDILLADRYADRTHFIFELLQNAEDVLARRPVEWTGPRSVTFDLRSDVLRVSHFGAPFNEKDVRGICAIGEGTKRLTDIGRFGIGFKSVYAFTDRPEVHSGSHAFAIDDYVLPEAVPPIERRSDETMFILPLKRDDPDVSEALQQGLRKLSSKALLFLRQIEEIRWRIDGGPSGFYLRESKDLSEGVRRVTVVGEVEGGSNVHDTWLVFGKPVATKNGDDVGFAEIAFRTCQDENREGATLERVEHSPLVVYFPTVVDTHLGFLLQGPYRTTPSRDNVPANAPWNRKLVMATGSLLVGALRWLRDHGRLDVATLSCLPLDGSELSHAHEGMFTPLFTAGKQALSSEPLLPRTGEGHVAGENALLARTGELRDLLNPRQLEALFGGDGRLWWLTGEITRNRTPDLHRYLVDELEVTEVTPESFVSKLKNRDFLEAQSDAWIRDLYHFLAGQPRLRRRFNSLPLVRLEDGSHVRPLRSGEPQAYLPGPADTEFPTVRAGVCDTDPAHEFLCSLGLSEPDPVDDVIRNVLPKYEDREADIPDREYDADIRRIVEAYGTDSQSRHETLVNALKKTSFVRAVNADGAPSGYSRPVDLYLPTERLTELFQGVDDVLFVDQSLECLQGNEVRRLLESAGVLRYIRPVQRTGLQILSADERRKLREEEGKPETSGRKDRVRDWNLHGLERLLEVLPELSVEERQTKARQLWLELAHLEERRGKRVFEGKYSWSYYGDASKSFDAAFVRLLNRRAWVPDDNGDLKQPTSILFDAIGWKEHPFLRSKIQFKPPLLDELAEEAGIDPGVLDVLKEIGVTSELDLRDRLGLQEEQVEKGEDESRPPETTTGPQSPDPDQSSPPKQSRPTDDHGIDAPPDGGKGGGTVRHPSPVDDGGNGEGTTGPGGGQLQPERGSSKQRRFISYLATRPDEPEADPDGLDRQQRMKLEEQAVVLILSREPDWQRTPPGNPGFDLYKTNEDGVKSLWCEVKAMTRSLDNRPVGMSRTQFEHAREQGGSYWLYVVEHAGTEDARIVRIQDPAGKARTFTFDRGWRAVADVDDGEGRDEG